MLQQHKNKTHDAPAAAAFEGGAPRLRAEEESQRSRGSSVPHGAAAVPSTTSAQKK
jgi:hypothetical protein